MALRDRDNESSSVDHLALWGQIKENLNEMNALQQDGFRRGRLYKRLLSCSLQSNKLRHLMRGPGSEV